MAVAGEVSLGMFICLFYPILCPLYGNVTLVPQNFFTDEHGIDFDQYGILIKVKFR